jgi:ribosome-binding protein aMBF1 (putative translation factor)
VTGRCVLCGEQEHLVRRVVGAGVEIDMCERCSHIGQQTLAIIKTLKPFRPLADKLVEGIIKGLRK